jgi:hypothetical protein
LVPNLAAPFFTLRQKVGKFRKILKFSPSKPIRILMRHYKVHQR